MSASTPSVTAGRSKRIAWMITSGVVGLLAVFAYFTRFSSDARAARTFRREMPADQIREIRIEPYTVSSLTDHVIVIRDRERIERIAALFRSMKPISPNHPHARWLAFIRFQLTDREYGGQIEDTDNQGGLFWMAGNVQGGWNYGSYRNDSMGAFFEQLVAEEKSRPTTP